MGATKNYLDFGSMLAVCITFAAISGALIGVGIGEEIAVALIVGIVLAVPAIVFGQVALIGWSVLQALRIRDAERGV